MRAENDWPRRFAVGSAVFAIILGSSVLIGWVTQTLVLVQVLPNLPFMVKNTAASFLLSGVALLAVALKGPRWIIVLAAGLVCVVNSLTITEYLFHVDFGTITEYLFHVDFGTGRLLGPKNLSVRMRPPGRIAPLPSVCFTLASVGLLLPPKVLFTRGAPFVGLIGSTIAAFGFASTIGTFGGATLTAFNSAIGFLVFGLGVVSLAWEAEGGPASSPPWLLGGVAIAAIAGTVGLWQAQVDTGRLVFDNLPLVVLIGGGVMATVFALTIYLAHRGHAQAAALRQSEARLHRTEAFLLEARVLSATGSFSLSPVTGEHWWSDQTHRIFDLDPTMPPDFQLMRGRTHPDDLYLFDRAVECAKRGQEFTTEFRLRMADGAVKYLRTVPHAIQVSVDEPFEFVGAVRDITYRRLSQQTLEKARADLARVARAMSFSALTASISHEVNQPLSGIITNASVCQRMLAGDRPILLARVTPCGG